MKLSAMKYSPLRDFSGFFSVIGALLQEPQVDESRQIRCDRGCALSQGASDLAHLVVAVGNRPDDGEVVDGCHRLALEQEVWLFVEEAALGEHRLLQLLLERLAVLEEFEVLGDAAGDGVALDRL